jgi:hypothetical protein
MKNKTEGINMKNDELDPATDNRLLVSNNITHNMMKNKESIMAPGA